MKRVFQLCGLAVLLLGGEARAINRDTLILMQSALEAKITNLARRYDKSAVCFVTVLVKKRSSRLPMTIYNVKDLSVDDSQGGPEIDSVSIRILTVKGTFPSAVAKVIEESATGEGLKVKVAYDVLPKELIQKDEVLKPPPTPLPTPTPIATPTPTATPVAQKVDDIGGKSLALEIKTLTREVTSQMSKRDEDDASFRQTLLLLGSIGIILFLLSLVSGFLGNRGFRGLFQAAIGALGNLSGGGSGAASAGSAAVDIKGPTQMNAPATKDNSLPLAQLLPPEALVPLFSDCYWSKEDSTAADLWQQLNGKQKAYLMENFPVMRDYASFLLEVDPDPTGAEQDPYYLKPLAIHHLDNEAVTEMVRANPILMKRLPVLRLSKLALGAVERLELGERAESDAAAEIPDFSQVPPSEPRKLPIRLHITSLSPEDEEALLEKTDLPVELKIGLPSLIWLAQCPEEQIEKALNPFSAKDLAFAWIGPEKVLETFMGKIPDRKRELLKSYLGQVKPSRESPTFHQLHMAGAKYNPSASEEEEGSDEKKPRRAA